MIIGYPGGAGGNWLRSTIEMWPLDKDHYKNFHFNFPSKDFGIMHSTECDFLLSGTYYLNMYVNHIFKFFHIEMDYYNKLSYSEAWLKSVAIAFWICEYDQVVDRIHFDYNKIIDNDIDFYNKVVNFQKLIHRPQITQDEYEIRRQKFVDSCVDVTDLVNNFDSMIWVSFILGQLMFSKRYPTFSIAEKYNYHLCQQFAKDNLQFCKLLKFHCNGKNKFSLDEQLSVKY